MIVIALLATALSVEFLLVTSVLLSPVPVAVDGSFVHSLMVPYQRNFIPQRDLFLYGLWIGVGVAIGACLLVAMKSAIGQQKRYLKPFLMLHMLVVFLMAHAAFEAVSMGNPVWAWPVFWGAFAGGAMISIFWPEFLSGISILKSHYTSLKIFPWVSAVLGCLFIFLVIFMPDLQAVVAMVYMGEYFHNWDFSLFGAVYAITQGLIPCVDVTTTYGFGAAVMAAKIVNLMGGFDYTKMLALLMWVGIIYFVLWFLLLRRFLASSLLAFAAIVCAMRMQMFNLMIDPFIWAPAMASVFRYCFDIGVFWMLWMHIQTRRVIFLAAGAFFVSLGLYHVLSTGMSMLMVFSLYTIVSALAPCLTGGKDRLLWRNHALAAGSVFVWTGLWFYLTVGAHLFGVSFQQNLVEFNSYYVRGAFLGLLTTPLLGHDYVSGIGGLIYPVFCLATFLYAAGMVILGQARGRDVFAGLLAFYALEAHSYYIVMVTQWYTMGFLGVFLIFYWITEVLTKAPLLWRRRIEWGLIVISLYCLMTDRLFTGYPNLLNFSRNPIVEDRTAFRVGSHQVPYFHQLLVDFPESFKLPVNSLGEKDEGLKFEKDFPNDAALSAYYEQETSWPEDTALIRRLTPEGGKAAVLSSFEVLLLQRADRKPFFYYFPLLNSRPLYVRNFMQTLLFSYPQLQKVIDQIETKKPPYIFMERIFLTSQVPQAYFYNFGDLIVLIQYILAKYEPAGIGKYLVAMKLKG